MTSLVQLLKQEGFKNKLSMETKEITLPIQSLPIQIECSNQKIDKAMIQKQSLSFESFQTNNERVCTSSSETSNSKSYISPDSTKEGPPMDEVAIRAVISIANDYIERYIKDKFFRRTIFEKCNSYLVKRKNMISESVNEKKILVNTKFCLENIDKLVQDQDQRTKKEIKIESLRNSIDLLTIIASLNSKNLQGTTCGIQNSHLSSCAQLYMAIVYKLQKNNRVCARHLMQVFCDAPFFARTYLVPEFWEQLFLPHLVHVKIWYSEEVETILDSNECDGEKEKTVKILRRVYNNKVDIGTVMFGVYYKQWLKVGTNEPSLPVVPLSSRPSRSANLTELM